MFACSVRTEIQKYLRYLKCKFQALTLSDRHIGAVNSSSTFHRISEAWDDMHTLNSKMCLLYKNRNLLT